MSDPRRFLPSTAALSALEAVDRLGSASAAAAHLNLTQGAVSRQMASLEAQLGVALVARRGVRMGLTPAGQAYARQVRKALELITQASLHLTANPSGGSLNLALLPAFGVNWLAPKLPDFTRAHPEVTLNLSTRLAPFDFATSDIHAAVHFGYETWADVSYLPLLDEHVIPVAAPALMAEALSARDLATHPLLHLQSRPRAWERWFGARDVEAPPLSGMLFDQFAAMAQAAIHGLGVALLPDYLARPEIDKGALILASDGAKTDLGSYYLVWPDEGADYAPLASFRSWLAGSVGQKLP